MALDLVDYERKANEAVQAQEQLYTTASLITSPRSAVETGEFLEMSVMTGLKTFVTTLAGHIAAEAARLG